MLGETVQLQFIVVMVVQFLDKVADVPFFAATALGVTEQETVELCSCSFSGFVQFLVEVLYVLLQCYDKCLGDRAENSGSSAVAALVGAVQFSDKVVEWVCPSLRQWC